MSNIALLTAAGIGSRTHQYIPKQFLSIQDKPIIIYTLEKFQNNPNIDKIVVICLDGWQSCLQCYAKQFNITKLESICIGGNTGFESILNGLAEIKKFGNDDDIVLIHDGNRPGVDNDIINNCISTTKEKGSAITYIPTNEVVFNIESTTPELLNRDTLYRTQTPHGAPLKYMCNLYEKAVSQQKTNSVAFCSLLHDFNEPINFVLGNEKNFKITYAEDIDLFKGLLLLGAKNDVL